MPIYLPKWVLRRLGILWSSFHKEEFTFEEAQHSLKDDSRIVALVLSKLKNNGWIDIKSDPNDFRRKVYKITHTDIVEKMVEVKVEA